MRKMILESQQKTQIQELAEAGGFLALPIALNEIFSKIFFSQGEGKGAFRKQKCAVLHLALLILETSRNISRGWIVCSLAGLLLAEAHANRPQTQIALKIREFLSH